MRLMGKRQIGELQLSELVITLMLSELASIPITNTSIPLLYAIIPIIILLSLEVIISFFVMKIPFLKSAFDGNPSIIVKRGVVKQQEMKKLRISMEELICQIRLKNISDISQVDYVILEQNGQFSVIPKTPFRTPTVRDLGISSKEDGISHPLIIDGKINEYHLNIVGHDREWITKRLKEMKLDLKDAFLFAIDDSGKEFLIKKVKD